MHLRNIVPNDDLIIQTTGELFEYLRSNGIDTQDMETQYKWDLQVSPREYILQAIMRG